CYLSMKVTYTSFRFRKWIGIISLTLAINQIAQAQLTPIWTVNYGQTASGFAQGLYYSNLNVFGTVVFSADTPTIDFNWGLGSPAAAVPVDRFSDSLSRSNVPQDS